MNEHTFREGLKDGIPICLGYISVSFSFGVLVVKGGLSALTAILISLTNVTSAGQLKGLDIILDKGPLLEMVLEELIINIRYALMSISLTQKLDSSFTIPHRLVCGFGMTDEIFGVASSKEGLISTGYFYGLMLMPIAGWLLGTALGGFAGEVLPEIVLNSMGIMLYAMFIAIVLPPAKKSRAVACCAAIAAFLSMIISLVPAFSFISSGFSVVICAVAASVPVALKFPLEEDAE